ncbi:hypothetical protein SPSYN_03128 [Sporotomaculum syntrophicum]|uniref:Four helix bundle protein n=2 Tax=Sporotomaculum syntrophicum TaxID=182264 RepID=A0A9D2WLM8_9FIRM|nr:four helix bundle protein [Sporotomaculum syntrophicum]KAF1083717.1 hypothetical protein SPSYN_03128 [Sporotomaculum syntrophicum]
MVMGYKNLEVYQRSYKLALEIHRTTQKFPSEERYELGSQLRRAAVSIPLNIAEGYGRRESIGEFQHFLRNALGSCNEVKVLLDMIKDLQYISEERHQILLEQYNILGKQIYRLREANTKKKI